MPQKNEERLQKYLAECGVSLDDVAELTGLELPVR